MSPPRPRWEHLLSEISKWDDRFERERAPWIELAVGLAAMNVLTLSLLAAAWDLIRLPPVRELVRVSRRKILQMGPVTDPGVHHESGAVVE